MTIQMNWSGYEPYVPVTPGLLSEASRSAALAEFTHLMACRPERFEQLRNLVLSNDGPDISLKVSIIDQLDSWFTSRLLGDPATERPLNVWFAVIRDTSLFLGDLIVSGSEFLEWRLFTSGKRDVSYQRAVIMGYPDVQRNYNFDIDRALATYATRKIRNKPISAHQFRTWYELNQI